MSNLQGIWGSFADRLTSRIGFQLSKPMQLSAQQWQEAPTASPKCIVIGREHYLERQQEFAIGNYGDLMKSLKLMPSKSPLAGKEFYFAQRQSESSHRVSFYGIKPALLEGQPWLCLPETLLLHLGLKRQGVSGARVIRPDGKVLLLLNGRKGYSSAFEGSQCLDVTSLASRVGEAIVDTERQLDYLELLKAGLKSLPPQSLPGFWLGSGGSEPIKWHQVVISCGVLLGGYLALSSVWVAGKSWWVESQLEAQQTEVTQVLSLQRQWRAESTAYQQLRDSMATQPDSAVMWYLVAQMMKQDSKLVITNIVYNAPQMIIRGKAVEAASMLELINDSTDTVDTRFSTPVRKDRRGLESFAIEFKLVTPQEVQL